MLSAVAADCAARQTAIPISGMGGISTWRDAAEFLLLGATSLQVCTAAMHYGFRIIEDLCEGLSNWMDSKGFRTVDDVQGRSLPRISDFKNFDLAFRAVARIDETKCIKCNLCYVACNDTAHQCIDLFSPEGTQVNPLSYPASSNGKADALQTRAQPRVREEDCVGCRLCYNVCPVHDCIQMLELPPCRESVTWDELSRTRPAVTEDWDSMEQFREEQNIHIH
jgi:dihydropyrimidine dehydrogenase (NAD+) subunit PreA